MEHTEVKSDVEHNELETGQVSAPNIAGSAYIFKEKASGVGFERRLVPAPSDDPLDPLTWTQKRKYLAYMNLAFFVFLSNFSTVSMGPGYGAVEAEFGSSQTQSSYLISFNVLMLGLGVSLVSFSDGERTKNMQNLFWIPLSVKIGKRPVLIASSAIYFAFNVWSATAKSYNALLAAKIIQGFGASASEALGVSIVADLFFLHERGRMVGCFQLMIALGSAFGGLFAGFVMNGSNGNWRWICGMNSILTGTCFLLILVSQPETNFLRSQAEIAREAIGESAAIAQERILEARAHNNWRRSLGFMPFYNREGSLLQFYRRPLILIICPAVVFGSLTYGVTVGWIFFQQNADSILFPELYKFSPLAVGNINIASLIAAIIGCYFGGPFSDVVSGWIARRRHGYFTPESRLWVLLPLYLFGPLGLLLWGVGIQNHLHWSVPIAGAGITYGVLCAVPSVTMTYVIDCYAPVAGEAITGLIAFKNTFGFAVSFAVIPWVMKGTAQASGIQVLIEGSIFLLTIPMYIWGAKARQMTNHLYSHW
ncbi:hypothetical protein MMC08_001389 [Hypocenomyce scalaris]|nr:hypothetical protein [Hypocenomyce scalaris]